jgi:hypothetical protein
LFNARVWGWPTSDGTCEDRVCDRRCPIDTRSTSELPELSVSTRHLLSVFEDDQRRRHRETSRSADATSSGLQRRPACTTATGNDLAIATGLERTMRRIKAGKESVHKVSRPSLYAQGRQFERLHRRRVFVETGPCACVLVPAAHTCSSPTRRSRPKT